MQTAKELAPAFRAPVGFLMEQTQLDCKMNNADHYLYNPAHKFSPPMSERKASNPKDLLGTRKVPLSTLPFRVLWRVGLAMLEGGLKYQRHNYRVVGVRASVYFDALMRHVGQWWEGEDTDPDSNLNHVDKAIACLMVLRDSMLEGNWVDDRPPRTLNEVPLLHSAAAALIDRYGSHAPQLTEDVLT